MCIRDRFDEYDHDGNGKLHREECVDLADTFYTAELRCLRLMYNQLRQGVEKLNGTEEDKRYILTLYDARFAPIMRAHEEMIKKNREEPDTVGRLLFDAIDKNKSGDICRDEFAQWVHSARLHLQNKDMYNHSELPCCSEQAEEEAQDRGVAESPRNGLDSHPVATIKLARAKTSV
eukprot:TRINITY_DN3566_c0_g1_i1.p1 TRINITY_DN3566_c0_g1~~TRINITY_DN3566_c0_g1_i1.p1  ORF type:complete len:176 (-),score=45.80 TRINITY_DN3566_c0_g1_i1:146-673(-)